jgi:hypothetical protein
MSRQEAIWGICIIKKAFYMDGAGDGIRTPRSYRAWLCEHRMIFIGQASPGVFSQQITQQTVMMRLLKIRMILRLMGSGGVSSRHKRDLLERITELYRLYKQPSKESGLESWHTATRT